MLLDIPRLNTSPLNLGFSQLLLSNDLGSLDRGLWRPWRSGEPGCRAPGGRVLRQHHDLLLALVDSVLWGDCQQDWPI